MKLVLPVAAVDTAVADAAAAVAAMAVVEAATAAAAVVVDTAVLAAAADVAMAADAAAVAADKTLSASSYLHGLESDPPKTFPFLPRALVFVRKSQAGVTGFFS